MQLLCIFTNCISKWLWLNFCDCATDLWVLDFWFQRSSNILPPRFVVFGVPNNLAPSNHTLNAGLSTSSTGQIFLFFPSQFHSQGRQVHSVSLLCLISVSAACMHVPVIRWLWWIYSELALYSWCYLLTIFVWEAGKTRGFLRRIIYLLKDSC